MEPKSVKWDLAANVGEDMRGVKRERVNMEM